MSRFGSGHDAAFFFHAPQSARGAAAGGAGSAVRAGGAQRLSFGLFAAGAAGGAGHGRAAASERGAGGACRSFAGAHWGGVSDQLHGGHCAGGGGGAVPAGGRPDGRAAGADAAAGVVAGHRQCHANQHHRAGFVFSGVSECAGRLSLRDGARRRAGAQPGFAALGVCGLHCGAGGRAFAGDGSAPGFWLQLAGADCGGADCGGQRAGLSDS